MLLFSFLFCIVGDTIRAQLEQNVSCYLHTETLPVALCAHFAVYNPTKNAVYLLGGFKDSCPGGIRNDVLYKWNMNDDNAWFSNIDGDSEQLISYNGNGNVAVADNKAYFIGVEDELFHSADESRIYVYDTDEEEWSHISSVPQKLRSGCLATNGTHIFMVDGRDTNGWTRKAQIHVYSISKNSWTYIDTNLTTNGGWRFQYCSLIEDELYIFGGTDGYYNSPSYINIYRLNIRTLHIEKVNANLSDPRAHGVGVGVQNFVYLVGSNPYHQNIVAFDTINGTVSTAFTTQETFASAAVLKINNKIYRFGGEVKGKALATVEICDLPASFRDETMSPSLYPSTSTLATTELPMTTSRMSSEKTTSTSNITTILVVIGVFIVCCLSAFLFMVWRMYRSLDEENESKYQIRFSLNNVRAPGAQRSFIVDDGESDKENVELAAVIEPEPAVVPVDDNKEDSEVIALSEEEGVETQPQDGGDGEGAISVISQ